MVVMSHENVFSHNTLPEQPHKLKIYFLIHFTIGTQHTWLASNNLLTNDNLIINKHAYTR